MLGQFRVSKESIACWSIWGGFLEEMGLKLGFEGQVLLCLCGGVGGGGEWTLLAEEITLVEVLEAEESGVTDL